MTTTDDVDAKQLAEQCAQRLWRDDPCSNALGMTLAEVAPGFARIRMTVRDDMLNGLGSCHGGMMFSLADTAFAIACNTYNQKCVAQHCNISYLLPVAAGETLEALAVERQRSGRNGIYDVTITDSADNPVAEFRGFSRVVAGVHLSDDS